MTCLHCAERIGPLSLFRRQCGSCGLSLRDESTAPSAELQALLVERPLRLRWLVAGSLLALLSLVPTLGLLQLLLVAPLQLVCVERATQDFTRHLRFRHALGFELASGLIFVGLSLGGSFQNLAGPIALLLALPSFWFGFWAIRKLAIDLATRSAEGRGVGPLVGALTSVVGALVLVPPVVLVAVTLHLSGQLQSHAWSTDQVVQLATFGAIGSADLFLMPAWLTCVFAFLGLATPSPSFSWVGSWWAVGLTTTAVFGEAVLDNALDRRRRFSRTTWPAIQSVLAPATLLFSVCALGGDQGWAARGFALIGGFALGSWNRLLFNKVKTAVSFLPGFLAQRRAQLMLIPWRMASQFAAVAFGWFFPKASTVLLVALAGASGLVVLGLALSRRVLRRDPRLSCSCGFQVRRAARICPKCHTAAAETLLRSHDVNVQLAMVRAARVVSGVQPAVVHLAASSSLGPDAVRACLGEAKEDLAVHLRHFGPSVKPAVWGDVLAVAASTCPDRLGASADLRKLMDMLTTTRSLSRRLLAEL